MKKSYSLFWSSVINRLTDVEIGFEEENFTSNSIRLFSFLGIITDPLRNLTDIASIGSPSNVLASDIFNDNFVSLLRRFKQIIFT